MHSVGFFRSETPAEEKVDIKVNAATVTWMIGIDSAAPVPSASRFSNLSVVSHLIVPEGAWHPNHHSVFEAPSQRCFPTASRLGNSF
jgi:hypothetical protein